MIIIKRDNGVDDCFDDGIDNSGGNNQDDAL